MRVEPFALFKSKKKLLDAFGHIFLYETEHFLNEIYDKLGKHYGIQKRAYPKMSNIKFTSVFIMAIGMVNWNIVPHQEHAVLNGDVCDIKMDKGFLGSRLARKGIAAKFAASWFLWQAFASRGQYKEYKKMGGLKKHKMILQLLAAVGESRWFKMKVKGFIPLNKKLKKVDESLAREMGLAEEHLQKIDEDLQKGHTDIHTIEAMIEREKKEIAHMINFLDSEINIRLTKGEPAKMLGADIAALKRLNSQLDQTEHRVNIKALHPLLLELEAIKTDIIKKMKYLEKTEMQA